MTAAGELQHFEQISGAIFQAGLEGVVHLACERACLGICTTISEDSGTTRGRKDRECGAMGVISVPAAGAQGCHHDHVWVPEQQLAVVPTRIAQGAVHVAHTPIVSVAAGTCQAP
jgi:hypothetical protein